MDTATAAEYVTNRLAPGAAILSAHDTGEYVRVDFELNGETFWAGVWIENGEVYGEW